MQKNPTKSQMKNTVAKLIGVKQVCSCNCCKKRNANLIGAALQLQNNIELASADDYEELEKIWHKSAKYN